MDRSYSYSNSLGKYYNKGNPVGGVHGVGILFGDVCAGNHKLYWSQSSPHACIKIPVCCTSGAVTRALLSSFHLSSVFQSTRGSSCFGENSISESKACKLRAEMVSRLL